MVTQVNEQSVVAEGTEQPSEEVVKSEDSKQEEVVQPKHVFQTDEELDAHIKGKADSIADKSLVTYQKKARELEDRITVLNADAENRKADDELSKREASETTEWKEQGVPDKTIGDFHRDRRTFNEWTRDAKSAYENFVKKEKDLTQKVADSDATILAIEYGLDGGADIVSKLKELITAISKGETPSEREVIAIKQSLKKGSPKITHKPDSPIGTAPGGVDVSKMSPSDKVSHGFKQLDKK